MATKRPRYMISVDEEMYEQIENFRYDNRYPTRSQATAELIRIGLESVKSRLAEDDEVRSSACKR